MSALTVSQVRSLFERQEDNDFPDINSTTFLDWMNFINNKMYFALSNRDENKFLKEFVYDVTANTDEYTLPSDLDFSAFNYSNAGVFTVNAGTHFLLLRYDAETGTFTEGLTVTGGTSGATGVISQLQDNGTTGYLVLKTITGTFQDNETITDTSTGSATTNGTGTYFSKSETRITEEHPYSSNVGYWLSDTNIVFTPIPQSDVIRVIRYLPLITELTGDSSETLFDSRFSNAIVRMTIRAYEIWYKGDINTADVIASDEINDMLKRYARTPRVAVIRTRPLVKQTTIVR